MRVQHRTGLLRTSGYVFSGVPVVRGPSQCQWDDIRTPAFPIVFVLISSIGFAYLRSSARLGFLPLLFTNTPSHFWPKIWDESLVSILWATWIILFQFTVAATLLRVCGIDDQTAKRSAVRAVYFVAALLPAEMWSFGILSYDGRMQFWSRATEMAALFVFIAAVSWRILVFADSLSRSLECHRVIVLILALLVSDVALVSFLGAVPMGMLYAGAIFFGAPLFLKWGWLTKHPPGHCQSCGYDLTGNVSGRCPECGTATNAIGKFRRDG